jgi:Zn-dependent protease
MRDPMSWALPLFRAFGIPVKLHIFFIIITLGLFLRVVAAEHNPIGALDVFLVTVVLLFGIILLHEFGHCFGARAVGGEAKEILIWPLGGLAMVDVPHNPRALFVTTAAGPGVNVLICVFAAAAMSVGGYLPSLNPVADPFVSKVHNFRDGRDYTSVYGLKLYKQGTAESAFPPDNEFEKLLRSMGGKDRIALPPAWCAEIADQLAPLGIERAVAPSWVVWLNRLFFLSWVLFLFNLIPAYPLDGGQLLQSVVWARSDYRRGVMVAAYSGYIVAVLFLIVSVWKNEALFMGLALFMLYQSSMRLVMLEAEGGEFGDFSAGYTSLERDDEPAPRVKRPGFFARWRQARKARKAQMEMETRARDEERKELLLEKIAANGMGSLTDEERRFLSQFSARYRNKS